MILSQVFRKFLFLRIKFRYPSKYSCVFSVLISLFCFVAFVSADALSNADSDAVSDFPIGSNGKDTPFRDVDSLEKEMNVSSFSSEITGAYLLSFHACDPTTTNCADPRNHKVYVAQSDDGFNWDILPGWEPTQGSVPDLIRRGDTLYVFYCYWGQIASKVLRYDFSTKTWGEPVSLKIADTEAPNGFVDMSATIDDQGRLVLFYLVAAAGQDPAGCAPGETTCNKRFRSATEVVGSDGTQFSADSRDRLQITIDNTSSASDPDIFFDGSRHVLYISRQQSVQVYTSQTLQGEYVLSGSLSDGYLTNSVGIACGYFDQANSNYWTYGHTYDGTILRAVHTSLDQVLGESDFETVITGDSMGLGESCQVQSPGFAVNTKDTIYPIPDIKANGSDSPVALSAGEPVSITISLDPEDKTGQNADWWIAVSTPFAPPGNWYTYVHPTGWVSGVKVCAQAGLFDVSPYEVLNMTLPVGNYTFYFALDDPDGAATGPWWGLDSVEVIVQ